MADTRALETLRETIKTEDKSAQSSGVAPNTAWLQDLYGYRPWAWTEDSPLALDEALKLTAVLVCMDVLAQDIAKTPLWLRRRLPNGGSEIVEPKEHWLAKMLALEPNDHHTWYEFLEMIILHLGAVQNCFIAKRYRDRMRTEIAELIPVLPGRVRILVDEEIDQYVYEVSASTPHERLQLNGVDKYLLEDEMIHVRGRMFDGLFGYSNLEAGSATMGFSKALQQYQTNLYKNDGSVRGVFKMKNEQALSNTAFTRLKEQLSNRWASSRTGGVPIVLEEGLEFQPVAMNADQAEVAKNRDKAVEDIARLFRIPPHKMMHIVNVKYENMDTLEKAYIHDTLVPICTRVEQRMSRALLSSDERTEYFLEFDRMAMQLGDIDKQSKLIETMMDRGAMTVDQALMRVGMNPLPNGSGNVRLIPQGFRVVNDANEVLIEAGQPTQNSVGQDNNQNADNAGGQKDADIVTFPKLRAE